MAPSAMLIAVDEEGGQVARLAPNHGFPPTVSAQYLGRLNDPNMTRQYASRVAGTLGSADVNLNLAPVVDLNVNPSNPIIGALGRSFSADPEIVIEQATAFIQAHHDAGILCTLKHFPGHGSSRQDSHLGFVDVTQTWSRTELIPFRRLIAAGQADAIMTAHVFNANLDSAYPATLSKKVIGRVLRGELGYEGVVITDDLRMAAISDYYGFAASLELAINAGADVVALTDEAGEPGTAFRYILQAVQAGRINEVRIDQSYKRIAALKRKLTA
jgi:beta-N-acetylhexosaminidase